MVKKSSDIKGLKFLYNITELKLSFRTKIKSTDKHLCTNARDTADIFHVISDRDTIELFESAWAMLLDASSSLLGIISIGQGTECQTAVNLRSAAQAAILCNARGVILSHNHPSGNLKPSKFDDSLTTKAKQLFDSIDVKMLDHIIISPDCRYYSYAENGKI